VDHERASDLSARSLQRGSGTVGIPSGSSATRKLTHYRLSELLSNQKWPPLAQLAGCAERG